MKSLGDPVHGEVDDANAGPAAVTVLLYPNGSSTAHTLAANERLTITDFIFVSTPGGKWSCYWGTDGDGLRIASGNAEALGGLAHEFQTPITGPAGVAPILLGETAGQLDLTIVGYITQL